MKPNFSYDAHNQQSLEFAPALNDHMIAGLLGRDCLHLNALAIDGPIGAGVVGPLATSPNLTAA